MTWQYRVIRHRSAHEATFLARIRETYPNYPEYSEWVDVREVFYKDNAPKVPSLARPEWVELYTLDPSSPHGGEFDPETGVQPTDEECLAEIKETLEYYAKAMTLPVLNEWELPGYREGNPR